jgi:hypothetical protein
MPRFEKIVMNMFNHLEEGISRSARIQCGNGRMLHRLRRSALPTCEALSSSRQTSMTVTISVNAAKSSGLRV